MKTSSRVRARDLAHCKELIGLMVDCEFTIEDFELIAHHAKGPLLEATENQLMKMDAAAAEKQGGAL
tara:strand:- start:1378 stop:1578 length:201 start_codon:yes stop_codon:yes gene_type:complete